MDDQNNKHPWQNSQQHYEQQSSKPTADSDVKKTEMQWYQYAWFFSGMDKLAMWCGIVALSTYLLTGALGAVTAGVLGTIELLHKPTERNKYFTIVAMGVAASSLIILLFG